MPSNWICAGNVATWQSECLRASLDVQHARRGFEAIQVAGYSLVPPELVRLSVRFFADTELPEGNVDDWYIRGADLIVNESFTHSDRPGHVSRATTYWRLLDEESLAGAVSGLDVIVSVTTSLLDASPQASVRSCLPAEAAWQCRYDERRFEAILDSPRVAVPPGDEGNRSGTTYLFQLPGVPYCFAQMVHPADRQGNEGRVVRQGLQSRGVVESKLFDNALEKGVILRGRVRVLFVPSADAQRITLASRDEFENSRLPLTT